MANHVKDNGSYPRREVGVSEEVYVPTRFMAQRTREDGSLILYCSMTGAIGVVPADKAGAARSALRRGARHRAPLEGIVGDLKQGGFLVPEGKDEWQALKKAYHTIQEDKSRLHLIILPTEECNFRCIYCYETFPAGRMRKSVREGIKKFIAKQEGLKYLHIAWFGGEPLLASDVVIELSQFFHEYCQIHSISLSSDMTTNGSLLVPEVFEQIVQYGVRSFQITIDGLPEDHDKRRVTIHGEGTFANILANLRYMKSTRHSFIVGLRNNFDPESIVKVNDFIGLMKAEFGGDPRFKLFFRPIGRLGGANDQSLMVCEAREAERIMMQAQRLAVEAGFRGGCSANLGHNRVLEPFSFVCYAANPRSFIISPQGKIYKCTIELGEKERNIVGRLSNEGELELDPIKMALWTESDGRREGAKCHACFFAPACVGAVCPKEWMDRNDCSCPTEKKRIGEALELAVMQKKLPTPVTA